MREIIYKFNNRGLYETDVDTSFKDDAQMKIIVEPHNFSISIGNETLRSSSYDGGAVVVSRDGEVAFYDNENNVIARAEKSGTIYKMVQLVWEKEVISVQFGYIATVDYYPNCDGEYDRWGKEWVIERLVELNLKDNAVEIK